MNRIIVMYQSHLLVKSMSNYSWKYTLFVLNFNLCISVWHEAKVNYGYNILKFE